jgi:hypothetical protein
MIKMQRPGSHSADNIRAVRLRRHSRKTLLSQNPNAPWATLEAWYAHQYDPGYYFASRFFPFMLGPRPNRFGYTLVVAGGVGSLLCVLLSCGALLALLTEGIPSWTARVFPPILLVFLFAWNAAIVASGVRLLLRRGPIRHRRRRVVVGRQL